jgi:hypothetical protein
MIRKFNTEDEKFQQYISENPQCFILRNADGSADVLTGSDIDNFLASNPTNQIETQQ